MMFFSPHSVFRPCFARSLSFTSQLCAKSSRTPGSTDGEERLSQPIKFSTSKASHRMWKVERSMGSRFQRPWWKVLPVSLFTIGFLLWCVLRPESDIDRALEKQLYEHLPGLLTNIEEEEEEEPKKEPDDGSKWAWFIIVWTFYFYIAFDCHSYSGIEKKNTGRSSWALCLKKIVEPILH